MRKSRLQLLVRSERGYTLIELVVVMALLLVVLGALTDGFVSASRTEVDQTDRASDQQAARQALETMRKDIHCASSANVQPLAVGGVPTGGYQLNLAETANACSGVTAQSSGVQWCTGPVGATGTRFALSRSTGGTCATAVVESDYLTSGNVWSLPTCATGQLPRVAVSMAVNRDLASRPDRTYELSDAIALRNAGAC